MIPSLASPEKKTIRCLFDSIAPRYDALNTLLSLTIDESWRKKAVDYVLENSNQLETMLDLGVGTGKFLSRFLSKRRWNLAVGLDFSTEMLARARGGLPAACPLLQADLHDLPFADQSFDLVVSSFTLRSVKDRPHFFKEVHRVLRPGGRAGFLCLTRPSSFLGRLFYAPYLQFYLPFIGGLLTRDKVAYRFLSESIQAFPPFQEIAREMIECGFQRPRLFPFTFGISTFLVAHR